MDRPFFRDNIVGFVPGRLSAVPGSTKPSMVDRGGFQSHEWKRVERLEAAWELARRGLGSSESATDSGLTGAVTEPKRRSRTPLTAKQIDEIHTARENGESVMSIARRFEVSRITVWEKTARATRPSRADAS